MQGSLVASAGLDEHQLSEIRQLEEACNNFEGLTMKLNWDLLRKRPKQLVNDFLYYGESGLIGYLALYVFNRYEAEVSAMTHPQYRRQGIFTHLLAAAREEVQRRGIAGFLYICEQASPSGAKCMNAIGARYVSSEYRMDLVEPIRPGSCPVELEIRPARLEDVGALAQMDALCFGMAVEQRRVQLARTIVDSTRQTLVATVGPAAVGKIHVTDEGDSAAYIYAFCVLPEYRGKGYGKAILADTVRQLTAQGYESISLEVATENRRALALYEQCGFAVTTAYDYYHQPVKQ